MDNPIGNYNLKDIASFLAWIVPIPFFLLGFMMGDSGLVHIGGGLLILRALYYYSSEMERV